MKEILHFWQNTHISSRKLLILTIKPRYYPFLVFPAQSMEEN